MYDQVLVSVFLGAACMVVYLEFLRETAVHEKQAEAHRFALEREQDEAAAASH